ncbi:MAG: glycosyl hydrolase, partial [Oscillospiraceae bacterium]|nr:glycosyl hydrolase [Oscillospiraceae bacterium]
MDKIILSVIYVFGLVFNLSACDLSDPSSLIKPETSVTASSESSRKLSNPDATKEAQALFDYICGTYREGIISGQQESTWMGSDQYEFDYIYKNTGKYPAIRGLDYMNDDFKGVNKRAADWHKRGGIVTICWHCGSDFSGSWSESMNTEIKDWDKALKKGTAEYDKLIKGMDKAAAALKELRDQNIPV